MSQVQQKRIRLRSWLLIVSHAFLLICFLAAIPFNVRQGVALLCGMMALLPAFGILLATGALATGRASPVQTNPDINLHRSAMLLAIIVVSFVGAGLLACAMNSSGSQ